MCQERILVVDDDETVREIVRLYLEQDGFLVRLADSGHSAVAALTEEPFDVVILDLMLPGPDGLEICRRLRTTTSTPVIMLTARASETDRVVGLELGADDYLVKPFSPRELVARVRSLLRRAGGGQLHDPGRLRLKDLVIDIDTREVEVGGRPVTLTALEFDLLLYLARHPRHVFTREQLLRQVWGQSWLGDPSAVTVLVRRLREKIEEYPNVPCRLQTVFGVGYRLSLVEVDVTGTGAVPAVRRARA